MGTAITEKTPAPEPVIEVRDMRKWYPTRRRLIASLSGQAQPEYVKAVDGVSFAVGAGEVLGLVGESGCGKSTTGMTALKLHEPTGGEIRFRGLGVLAREDRRTRLAFRRQAQIVFQNPYEALNPRYTVEQSVREPIAIHFPGAPEHQRALLIQAMERAGLVPVANFLDRYPHQMSGGQLQRIAIARAISVEPQFLVADEPVSMLDVSIRAGILNLLRHFARELEMAILYISHDLSTMRHVCTTIAVMYLGRIIEMGPAEDVLDRPRHPYAQALVAAVPVMSARTRTHVPLSGALPDPTRLPRGCRFHPRCPRVMARCREVEPTLLPAAAAHQVACHLYD
ncbi:MAG: ABC transporter ATP-binding protein [Acetobacteraceae bacterium]